MGNREKGEAMGTVMSTITEDMADQLKTLDHVEGYNYSVSVSVNSDGISPVEIETSTDMENAPQRPNDENESLNMMMGDFTISGNTTMAYVSEFMDEQYVLSVGRLLSEEDQGTQNVVISDTLASDNDLSVGSTFTVSTVDGSQTMELTVVGIYTIESSNEMGNMRFNQQNPYNTLYLCLDSAQTLNGSDTTISSATFYLDDPENIESFKEAATSTTSIDWETYTLDANDQAYQRNVSTLENMESFAKIFVIVVVIAGGSILCLILMLTVKNRIYEIGVLVSLGETKLNIILQQFLEIFLVGVVAFTLSLGTGQMISNTISGMLQANENSQSQVMMEMPSGPGGNEQENTPSDQPMQGKEMFQQALTKPENSELDVSLTMSDTLQLAGITTLICIVSTLLPAMYILRLSPREILVRKEG